MRLSDVLIKRGLVTREQVDAALEEQRQLRAIGDHSQLGTILLVERRLTPEELGRALAGLPHEGFGKFGDYLLRRHAVNREQLSNALAYQSALIADEYRRYGRRRWRVLPFGRRRGAGPRKPVPRIGDVLVMLGYMSARQADELHAGYVYAFNAAFY